MRKLASVALVAALGIGAAALSKPADAGVAFGVGIGLPGVVVAPPAVGAPVISAGYYPGYYGYYGPGWRGGYRGWGPGWYGHGGYGYGHGYGHGGYGHGGWHR